jgi:hypothetical protein
VPRASVKEARVAAVPSAASATVERINQRRCATEKTRASPFSELVAAHQFFLDLVGLPGDGV